MPRVKMPKFLPQVLLLVLYALLSPAGTAAQTPSPSAPRFAFVESGPIVLAPGGDPITAVLQNNTADKVDVVVEVIAVDPRDPHHILAAVDFKPIALTLPAAGSVVIKVDPPAKADAEFGDGYLIAVEPGKAFARRAISGRHPLPATPTPSATPPIVEPSAPLGSFESVNLPGINFLPSFTSRHVSNTTLLMLILLCLFVPWLWQCFFSRSSSQGKATSCLLPATLVVLLGVALSLGWWHPNLSSRIIVPPISLTASQPSTGGLISDDGSLGKLEADGAQLKATGIPRAGTYQGSLTVHGSASNKESKTIKVVTNVSDWWPYALIAITLGVLLGYYLTRYFKQKRGEEAQRVRAAQIWRRVSEEESGFQLSYGGQPFAGYSIAPVVKEWLLKVEDRLTAHDASGAKSSLDRLDVYVGTFIQFRGQLLALNSLRERVLASVERSELESALESVFTQAGQALNGLALAFSPDEEQNSATLKRHQEQVQSRYAWLADLERALKIITRYTASAEEIETQGWSSDERDKLKEEQDKLAAFRRAAIRASQPSAVKEAEDAATVTYKNILQLVETAGMERAALDFMAAIVPMDAVPESHGARSLQVSKPSDSLIASRAGEVNADDLHVFTATATVPATPQTYQLLWDFADGTTSDIPAAALRPGEQVQLRVSHRFDKGGIYVVSIKNGAGETLGSVDVQVDEKPGRAERLLMAFRLTECQMSLITGLLAVGLGFYTLYLNKAMWGRPVDYLYALLWGSVVSEGLKYAAGLVDRVWNA